MEAKIENLTNADADKLVENLSKIMRIAEKQLFSTEPNLAYNTIFVTYKLARDSIDLLTFDAVSRDVVRKLTGQEALVVNLPSIGAVTVPDELLSYIRNRNNHKIDCIKETRHVLGMGLKDAKDLVEYLNGA